MRTLSAGILPLFILVSGCSSITLQRERIARVRSVVLSGITVEIEASYEQSGESFDPQSNSWHPKDQLRISERNLAESRDVERMHAELLEALEKRLGWKVVPAERLAGSEEYSDLLRFQLGSQWEPDSTKRVSYAVPGHLHFKQAMELSPESRARILKETGADAAVATRILLRIDRADAFAISNVLGVGAYYPTVLTEFAVFDHSGERPIWLDPGAESKTETGGAFQIGGKSDDAVLMEKALAAVQSSLEAIMARYQHEH